MKIAVKKYNYITDSSHECSSEVAFVQTSQNSSYIEDAKSKGATTLSLSEAYEALEISDEIKIIGITGTNGKTTTAAALYSMMLDLNLGCGLQGTRGCFINDVRIEEKSLTTPPILQTLFHLSLASKQKCKYFVMEVSSHAMVQNRIEGLDFALKIFTNITQDHLDFHYTMDEYKRVKSSFFQDDSLKLINVDAKGLSFNKTNTHTYSIESPSNIKVSAYSLNDGIKAVITTPKHQNLHVESSLMGEFNLYNLLASIGAIELLEDVSKEDLEEAIWNFGGVSGRMEVVSQEPKIVVDFAHTPDGIEKVLSSLKSQNLIVVFGAGGDRDPLKRPLMGKIVKRFAKRAYITSDNPRSEEPMAIIEQIRGDFFGEAVVEVDRKEAIHQAISELENGDILVILGKGDEEYQEIGGVKYPFDDRVVVREFLTTCGKIVT